MKKYKICDLIFELDMEESIIHERFNAFECAPDMPSDVVFTVRQGECSYPAGLEFVQNGCFKVGQQNGNIYLVYGTPEDETYYAFHSVVYEDNGKKISYYLREDLGDRENPMFNEALKRYLFSYMREAVFQAVRMAGGISIHSASIIYKDKGIVFSAPSKTGKSTHTNMWEEQYGTPVLDGDVTVCRIIDGVPYIYGLPWAGSSGKYINRRVELDSIVFLEQRDENVISVPQGLEAFSRLYSRSFSPRWLPFQVEADIDNTNRILNTGIRLYVLGCRPDAAAAAFMKQRIDSDSDR